MADWALFWLLMFVSAVVVLGWAAFVLERARRRERETKLMWKRMYFEVDEAGREDER